MKIRSVKPLDCPSVKTILREFLLTEINLQQQGHIQKKRHQPTLRRHLFECDVCAAAYFDLVESSLATGVLHDVSTPAPPVPMAPTFDAADLYSLAAESLRSNTEPMPFRYLADEKFVQIERDEYIITLWEGEEGDVTLIGLKIKSGFEPSYEGRTVVLADANNEVLLEGEIYSGEISEQVVTKIAGIKSPLCIALSGSH